MTLKEMKSRIQAEPTVTLTRNHDLHTAVQEVEVLVAVLAMAQVKSQPL